MNLIPTPMTTSVPASEGEAARQWHKLAGKEDDLASAEQVVLAALEQWPESALLVRLFSETRRRQGSPAEALLLALKAVALGPEDPAAQHHLAGIHLWNGNLPAATVAAQAALRLQPQHLGALLRMSELMLRRGDTQAAHRWADQALSAHPKSSAGYHHRATVHLASGELDFAINALQEALTLSPDHPGSRQRLDYALALRRITPPV